MDLTLRIDGVPELKIKLRDIIAAMDDLQVFQSIASEGARLARGFAPVASGRLRATIRGSKSKNKAVIRAGNNTNIRYAAVQQWGWPKRNIRGQHFMTRADEALKPRLEPIIENAIRTIIRNRGLS